MRAFILLFLLALPAVVFGQSINSPEIWDTTFSKDGSPNGPVYTTIIFQGSLIIGGNFTHIGAVEAHNIARRDNSGWHALDTSNQHGTDGLIHAMCVDSSGHLYIGGEFRSVGGVAASNIARFDGNSWVGLDRGLDSAVWALAACDTALAIGGNFDHAGGQPITSIALYNFKTSRWSAIPDTNGAQRIHGKIRALSYLSSRLAIGSATQLSIDTSYIIIRVDNKWIHPNFLIDGPVYAIDRFDDNNFSVGGGFSGGFFFANVGFLGTSEPFNANGPIFTITHRGHTLAIGGAFTTIDQHPCKNLLLWSARVKSDQRTFPLGWQDTCFAICPRDSNFFIGGSFSSASHGSATITQYNSIASHVHYTLIDDTTCYPKLRVGRTYGGLQVRIVNNKSSNDSLIFRSSFYLYALSDNLYYSGSAEVDDSLRILAPGDTFTLHAKYYLEVVTDHSFAITSHWFDMYSNADEQADYNLDISQCPPPLTSGKLKLPQEIDFGTISPFSTKVLSISGWNSSPDTVRILGYILNNAYSLLDSNQHLVLPYDSLRFSLQDSFGIGSLNSLKEKIGSVQIKTNDQTYFLALRDSEIMSKSSNIKLEKKQPTLGIFPNPARDQVLISSPNDVRLAVYNMLGQRMEIPVHPALHDERYYSTLDVRTLPNGVYHIISTDYQGNSSYTKLRVMH